MMDTPPIERRTTPVPTEDRVNERILSSIGAFFGRVGVAGAIVVIAIYVAVSEGPKVLAGLTAIAVETRQVRAVNEDVLKQLHILTRVSRQNCLSTASLLKTEEAKVEARIRCQ